MVSAGPGSPTLTGETHQSEQEDFSYPPRPAADDEASRVSVGRAAVVLLLNGDAFRERERAEKESDQPVVPRYPTTPFERLMLPSPLTDGRGQRTN